MLYNSKRNPDGSRTGRGRAGPRAVDKEDAMNNGAEAAVLAAIAPAVKALRAIVRLNPEEFQKILNKAEAPLEVQP
jgi:uncharacterized protein YeaO (DUF488 family)